MNPYQGAKDHQFWRKAVSRVEHHSLDPVTESRFTIKVTEKISTAGSCFAQHISRRLTALDYNYFIPENGEHLADLQSNPRGYGVFSARYGNIYTVRQLLHLFQEAFSERPTSESPWARTSGVYVDPFRPNIEPEGFADPAQVAVAREEHLGFVRSMFLESNVFIFTLGLTEAWVNCLTGDVFPLAPGVVAGDFDDQKYAFVNFSIDEVRTDLNSFLDKLKLVNPKIKVLLTVSPVPLIATAEDRHVLVSTTYSKSVLRVAVEDAIRKYPWVDYFPSFEIITGNYNMGRYYEDDLREVNMSGVDHAMRCFIKHYVGQSNSSKVKGEEIDAFSRSLFSIICDEESIVAARF